MTQRNKPLQLLLNVNQFIGEFGKFLKNCPQRPNNQVHAPAWGVSTSTETRR